MLKEVASTNRPFSTRIKEAFSRRKKPASAATKSPQGGTGKKKSGGQSSSGKKQQQQQQQQGKKKEQQKAARFKFQELNKNYKLLPAPAKRAAFGKCYLAKHIESNSPVLIAMIKKDYFDKCGDFDEDNIHTLIGSADAKLLGLRERVNCYDGTVALIIDFDVSAAKDNKRMDKTSTIIKNEQTKVKTKSATKKKNNKKKKEGVLSSTLIDLDKLEEEKMKVKQKQDDAKEQKSRPIDVDTCATWKQTEEWDIGGGGGGGASEKTGTPSEEKKKTDESKSLFTRLFGCTGPALYEDDKYEYLSHEIDENYWSIDLEDLGEDEENEEDDIRDEREFSNKYSEDNNCERREDFEESPGSFVSELRDDDVDDEYFDSFSECSLSTYGEEEGFFESLF